MANKGAQTADLDPQIMQLDSTLPGSRTDPEASSVPSPEMPSSAIPSHPPPVHSNNNQHYNIHQRVRQHQGHPGGRLNHSPSIRQSWLFPTNRASPSTALPETTSVMTLNQRPHNVRTEASSSIAASSATAQSVPPSVTMNHHQRRNFSGSARSRLTKIDRLSKMMLNPNASAPNLMDGPPLVGLPGPASPRRARLSLQPHTIPVTTDATTSRGLQQPLSAHSLSPALSSTPHTTSTTNNYPRHIIMRSTSPHRTLEEHLDSSASADSFSSSLPSAPGFAAGVDPSHNREPSTLANTEKASRHASMPLPKPGWRLYDLPDVEEAEAQRLLQQQQQHQHDHGDGSGSGFGSSGSGEERNSFQYSASNASSTTNLENHSYPYHGMVHSRQDSDGTFYSMTPNASNVDLSLASSHTNLSSMDPSVLSSSPDSNPSTSPTVHLYQGPTQSTSSNSQPSPLPKANRNNKSPLALRRSSTISSTSSSPSTTFLNKPSFPKSSLSTNAIYTSKTVTMERQKIILEILRTERSYVDGLVILQNLFYEPLNAPYAPGMHSGMNTTTSFNLNTGNNTSTANITVGAGAGVGAGFNTFASTVSSPYYASSTMGSNSTLSASAAPLLTKKSVAEIFSNFSEILQINTLLLTQLETRICGDTLSTGWESDEDEAEESGHRDGNEGDQHSSQDRQDAEKKLNRVLVTVEGQNGEQEQLLVLDADWIVGDIFIEIAPFLKMYSNYVKTYTSALTHINDCMNRNDRFTEFLKATAKRPECKNLDFQAFLMLPVQRIPRYKMLLESLLRHTPDDHPDHRKLQAAFESMEQTANFVNETIRQHEMFGEMVDLQSKITGLSEPLIIPGRSLLKRGNVWKVCRRNVQLRVIILLSDCILWTSPSLNPLDDTLTFHRKVGLENSTVIGAEDPDPTKNAFQIISPEKSSQVYVDTPREKEAWMVAIRKATQEYLSAKRTLKISITPMQSISAAATSFTAGFLRRDTGLWSPTSVGGDTRANPLASPIFLSSEVGNGGAWPAMEGGYPPTIATTATVQKPQQPLRVVENYNAPVWVPDHSATRCMICSVEFGTIIRRKHHCRACGKVVCHSCSSRTILIKGTHSEKIGRACDDCIDTMFPEEDEEPIREPVIADNISAEPLSMDQQQQLQRGANSDPDRRASNNSMDSVIIQPGDYPHDANTSGGATGMVRGFVEAGLSRMKSRSGHENINTDGTSKESARGSNRKSDSHFANATDYHNVKECELCRTEFNVFTWRKICSQCRRVVCSDCLTKKQIDQLFLLGLEAEREAKARGINFNAEDTASSDVVSSPQSGTSSNSLNPQDLLTRPGLLQSVSDSAVETESHSDLVGGTATTSHRSQSFNQNDISNNNSGGYGGFGNGWRGIKGNTDSGHGQSEKLCDPCYLGLSADQVKVLESGGGWEYYQATLGKHQPPGLAAALALSNMSLENEAEEDDGQLEGLMALVRDGPEAEAALVRAG